MTAFFVDECRRQGQPWMAKTLKGQVARNAKELLDNGCTPEEVEAGIRLLIERRATHAMGLGELVLEKLREGNDDPAERPSNRRRAQDWIDRNGWPTGVRLRRGSHGFQEVQDVLGTERRPSDWPHPKPTFDDVARALATADQSGRITS
jgi:hypothetical protein